MALTVITGGGAFTPRNISDINANFSALQNITGGIGNVIYCYPASPAIGTQTGSASNPYTTLADAYGAGRSGFDDVIVLVSNGAASGTARISSTFTWAKNALHLVGVNSGVNISSRSRIAPNTTDTAFANFFIVSGNGCLFSGIEWFDGFTTGTTAQICMTVTGQRNNFVNCHIAGMGDNESAQDTGSRSVKISGGGAENMFQNCVIGLDTITRTVANASVEFAGATARNQFIDCTFPLMTSSASVLGILGTGNGCVDRFQQFKGCTFINAIKSTSTQMTALLSFTTASPGGLVLFYQSSMVGVTKWGDTNGLANSYIDGLTGVAATSGLAVNPS